MIGGGFTIPPPGGKMRRSSGRAGRLLRRVRRDRNEIPGKVTPNEPDESADAPDALAVGLSGALGKQYASDVRLFLAGLARLLEDVLPGEARVTRVGRFGGASRPVKSIEVDVAGVAGGDATRYVIENTVHRAITATRTRVVRGIALKTEPISVADWIAAVGAAVAARARDNEAGLDALKSFLT